MFTSIYYVPGTALGDGESKRNKNVVPIFDIPSGWEALTEHII